MLILWEKEEEQQIFEAAKQTFFFSNFFNKNEENNVWENFFLIKYDTKEKIFLKIFKIHPPERGAKWRQTAKKAQFPVQNELCAASMGVKIDKNQ